MSNEFEGYTIEGERVLIEVAPKQLKTKGGIYMPDDAEVLHMRGMITAVGEDVKNPRIVKDAIVIFNQNSGAEILLNDKSYKIILQHEIWLTSKE